MLLAVQKPARREKSRTEADRKRKKSFLFPSNYKKPETIT